MRFIRLASFALFFALFGELSSYGQIDQELISVEWKKLEKRVRKIAKKSKYLDQDTEYQFFPVFWVGGDSNALLRGDLTLNQLSFSYEPRPFFCLKRYAKATILVADRDSVVAIAYSKVVYRFFFKDDVYNKLIMLNREGRVDFAFIFMGEKVSLSRLYYFNEGTLHKLEQDVKETPAYEEIIAEYGQSD